MIVIGYLGLVLGIGGWELVDDWDRVLGLGIRIGNWNWY